jgi:hypothetical protein
MEDRMLAEMEEERYRAWLDSAEGAEPEVTEEEAYHLAFLAEEMYERILG